MATLREKRRRKRVALVTLGGIFVAALLTALFSWPRFSVEEITLEGEGRVSERDLTVAITALLEGDSLWIFPRRNIFRVNADMLETVLRNQFPDIASIKVSRGFPDALRVTIAEREERAVLCEPEGQCAFLDAEGYIFKESPYFSPGVYLEFRDERYGTTTEEYLEKPWIGETLLPTDVYRALVDFAASVSGVRFTLQKDGDYRIETKEGWEIKLADDVDLELARANLKIFMREVGVDERRALEYVDVRFGNKIFYK